MRNEKERLEYKVFTRVGKGNYDELCALLEQSDHRTMSSLLRNILMQKEITIKTYDASLDTVMEELSRIRSELQAIGININQITRRFHTEQLPGAQLNSALEVAKLYQKADQKVSELFPIIAKLSEKWLPG